MIRLTVYVSGAQSIWARRPKELHGVGLWACSCMWGLSLGLIQHGVSQRVWSSTLHWLCVTDLSTEQPHTPTVWHVGLHHSASGAPQVQNFGSEGVVAALVATSLGATAINADTSPPLPHFWTHRKPHRLYMASEAGWVRWLYAEHHWSILHFRIKYLTRWLYLSPVEELHSEEIQQFSVKIN